jgi:ubiquinone/menaquinone biosynthesis C-methylase UbiE
MNEDLKRWDEAAEEWTIEIEPKRSFRPILVQSALTELLGDNLRDKKILDAGCGDGVHSNYLQNKGAVVEGVDGSPKMIKLAQSKFAGINFQVVDLLGTLPFTDESFDVVLSVLVFMSLEDISAFLKEAARVLKPTGNLICIVHHPSFGNTAMRLYKSVLDKILGRKPKGLIETYYPGLKIPRKNEHGATKEIPYYHRTFEEYSKEFNQADFVIKTMLEPHHLPENFLAQSPKLEYVTRLPRFMVFNLIKL